MYCTTTRMQVFPTFRLSSLNTLASGFVPVCSYYSILVLFGNCFPLEHTFSFDEIPSCEIYATFFFIANYKYVVEFHPHALALIGIRYLCVWDIYFSSSLLLLLSYLYRLNWNWFVLSLNSDVLLVWLHTIWNTELPTVFQTNEYNMNGCRFFRATDPNEKRKSAKLLVAYVRHDPIQ